MKMFRDEGTEPVIRFKQRMNERVQRTPTSLLIIALPFLGTARLAIIARNHFVRAHNATLARQIDVAHDLRTQILPGPVSIDRQHGS